MEMPKHVLIPKKENNNHFSNQKDCTQIETKNTCHSFKISFIISPKNSIPQEFQSQKIIESSYNEMMIIQAELLNKNESFFIENIEKVEIAEKYCGIYSLAELKNNNKGFEWFYELKEFKNAFLNGINSKNYELLLIKNILLLSINITNIFGINNICHILMMPCIYQNKVNELYFENINFKSNLENKNINVNSQINQNKKISISKSDQNYSLINGTGCNKNNDKNEFLEKKRKTKKISKNDRNSPANNNNFSLNISNNNNNENETNINNIYSINNIIDNFIENLKKNMKQTLPEFKTNALIEESTIIKNLEEESLITDMISILKLKKYRLIFRATRDGDSASQFHTICDNYSKLIILIETQKGLRFGGFTSRNFKVSSHVKDDNNSFLFSLDLKKVYKIMPGKNAIYCYHKTGPCFSQESLYVPNNFFKNYGKTRICGGSYQFEKDYEINNGEKFFLVKELEVFQVKVENL